MIDLDEEMWISVDNVRQGHLDRIETLGVSRRALATLGAVHPPLGVQRVLWLPDGLYEPDPDGEAAAILPVFQMNGIGFLDVVDLIAWKTGQPKEWRWRIGQGWALGDFLLDDDLPVPVVATPLDWLKAAGDALCILDWSAPPQCWARLRSGPSLQFSDDALRLRVRNALVANVALPPMEVLDAA
jgi:hypothetical protein